MEFLENSFWESLPFLIESVHISEGNNLKMQTYRKCWYSHKNTIGSGEEMLSHTYLRFQIDLYCLIDFKFYLINAAAYAQVDA